MKYYRKKYYKNKKMPFWSNLTKKEKTLNNWKKRGLKYTNLNKLYEEGLTKTHCEHCNKEFDNTRMGRRCMDHDHFTHLFRAWLCAYCNLHRLNEKPQLITQQPLESVKEESEEEGSNTSS
jgi:hypothetical protein